MKMKVNEQGNEWLITKMSVEIFDSSVRDCIAVFVPNNICVFLSSDYQFNFAINMRVQYSQ